MRTLQQLLGSSGPTLWHFPAPACASGRPHVPRHALWRMQSKGRSTDRPQLPLGTWSKSGGFAPVTCRTDADGGQ